MKFASLPEIEKSHRPSTRRICGAADARNLALCIVYGNNSYAYALRCMVTRRFYDSLYQCLLNFCQLIKSQFAFRKLYPSLNVEFRPRKGLRPGVSPAAISDRNQGFFSVPQRVPDPISLRQASRQRCISVTRISGIFCRFSTAGRAGKGLCGSV